MLQSFQSGVQQAGPAAGASYSLIGAIVLFGGIGYAYDAWQATSPRGVTTGLILGVIVGFYMLAKAVCTGDSAPRDGGRGNWRGCGCSGYRGLAR
jgi:F0F1-type ATP synthase assembly protein I